MDGTVGDMVVCLSPNGLNVHQADSAPTRLLVATAGGISVLDRETTSAEWRLTATSLEGQHPSSLLNADEAVFAGMHTGGLYVSPDRGETWERRTTGLTIDHVFSLRATPHGTILAGTEPVSLFTSDDQGQHWQEHPAIHQVPSMEKWTFPGP